MGKQSGLLLRMAAQQEEKDIEIQLTVKQFMIDTLQIALNEELDFGYDRLMKITNAWEKQRAKYRDVIDPRAPECDVQREHMDRRFREITKGKGEFIPAEERYQYVVPVSYEKKGSKKK